MQDYLDHDAVELAALIRRREVTATEVHDAALARAGALNPALNAIVTPIDDGSEAWDGNGPLAGVPFLIKDLAAVAGVRCSMGSRLWSDFVPDHDADIVTRYRKAGLRIIGKSNTPEVGLAPTTEGTFLGACRNPFDVTRTAGGSSGGAAAAVAAGILPMAHATDGGGSIRIPAACCGLVGLKPTRGRTPLGPDVGEGWGSMATAHVVSRTVRDTAIALDVTHGPALGDPYHPPHFSGSYFEGCEASPGSLRIAIDLEPASGATGLVDPRCAAAVQQVATVLESLGHRIVDARLKVDGELLSTGTYALIAANVANTIRSRAELLGLTEAATNERIETNTQSAVQIGEAMSARDYARGMLLIHQVGRTVSRFLTDVDMILSPTLLQPPVELGYLATDDGNQARYGEHIRTFWGFTHLYNATGHPAISLPLTWTDDGLPIGIQFAAAFGNELGLLQLSRQLEQAMPWQNRYRDLWTRMA